MTRIKYFFILILWLSIKSCDSPVEVDKEKIFYSSFRPEGWDIYLSTNHGETFQPFTNNESLDYDAKISPDGKWVVFTSERNGAPKLYIKSIAGKEEPRLLVKSNSMQDQIDFSPDGKWIVFVSTHQGQADIYKLPFSPDKSLDISQAENLTNNPDGDFRPRYSNSGKYIAFSSDRNHTVEPHPRFPFAMLKRGDVFIMKADGTKPERLTNSKDWEGSPSWSLDDKEIIYYTASNRGILLKKLNLKSKSSEIISPEELDCLSPLIVEENEILFTNSDYNTGDFSILKLNPTTKEIDSSYVQDMDMHNIDYHPSGIMVYHGGKKPLELESNKGGADGDLLVKNHPSDFSLKDKNIELFGVRRFFAAPPAKDGEHIIFDNRTNDSVVEFLSVDYNTKEVDKLFEFEVDTTFYSNRSRVIDMKLRPDGKSLQFTFGQFRTGKGIPACVYVYDFDLKKLEMVTDSLGNNGFADFSLNNSVMVYRSGKTGEMDIYLKESNRTSNITNSKAKENFPVISRDGNTIAFCSDETGKLIDNKVKTMDVFATKRESDNSWGKPVQLTKTDGQEGHLFFSPDGEWLVYTTEEYGRNDESPLVMSVIFSPQLYGEITAIRLKDGLKVRMTHNKWEDGAPIWID